MKYSFPAAATQILYPRPTHHYANNYHHLYHHPLHHPHHHHHHQPEQRTQLMIIKRPVLMRRPILQNTHTMTSPTALPSRPVFLERKKAVYRMPAPTYIVTPDKQQFSAANHQMSRIMKFDGKQRNKLESKVSDGIPGDITNRVMEPMKPARNTGFNPDSIVIEGGFKPIVRNVEKDQDLSRRKITDDVPQTDTFLKENADFRSIDNFEPVFIPSPPVPIADPVKKTKKKTRNTKVRLEEFDDMEMAADRINVHYLPPGPNSKLELPTSSGGLLVTYDGKKLKDLNLARSISNIEEHSKSRLSSDILSRTPQFGRFKGELPPPIPGEIRVDDTVVADKRGLPSVDLSLPEIPRKNTKLTLVARSKRFARDGQRYQEHRVEQGDHRRRRRETISGSVNAGQTIWSNLGYILLTGIFYYVI